MRAKLSQVAQLLLGIALGLALLIGLAWLSLRTAERSFDRRSLSTTTAAVVAVDATERHFGQVAAGATLQARFAVRNLGSSRLILYRVNGGCDCVKADDAPIVVAPGSSQTIFAKLETAKHRGHVRSGSHFTTNAANCPRLSLYCTANILAPEHSRPSAQE